MRLGIGLEQALAKLLLVLIVGTWIGTALPAQESRAWGEWIKWGEQSDGSYLNPIITADFSDIDCIRVGEDYYAISSTFQFSPGMTLLHSKDLVNWEICANIVADLTQISPELNWDRMNRYARGIWAGTLRHHAGRFYLFFGTPDEGFFMSSSPSPAGPWEPLSCLLSERGWDDCSVIWDEDGKAWFAGTHFSDGYKSYIFEMSADGKSIDLDSRRLINEGNRREASKLIKVGEWYYLIFSEHIAGVGRYVLAKRSKLASGPYEEERQLALPSLEANEPNQGGIVQGPDGKWYFLTHHGSGDWSGRIVSLLPVTWIDGWPVIGEVLPSGLGTMQWSAPMPKLGGGGQLAGAGDRQLTGVEDRLRIQRSDEFSDDELGPQWQWNYQPREGYFSLSERPGWLRLKAFRPLQEGNLLKAGNTLTQRSFRQESSTVVVRLDLSSMADGMRCGLGHFSKQYSSLGVVQRDGRRYIEFGSNGSYSVGPALDGEILYIKSDWGLDGLSHYYYSSDGESFLPFGEDYQLSWGNYRGDRIAIFCFNDLAECGSVDIDYLRYE